MTNWGDHPLTQKKM